MSNSNFNDQSDSSKLRAVDVPPLPVHAVPTAHREPSASPVLKGCAIASLGVSLLWMIPVALLVGSVFGEFFNLSIVGRTLPLFAVLIIVFAITRIALAGRGRGHAQAIGVSEVAMPKRSTQPLTAVEKREQLFGSLSSEMQKRHHNLIEKIGRLKELAKHVDDFETKAQLGPGLEKLQWLHLKSLLARENLRVHTPAGLADELGQKIAEIRESLGAEKLSENARKSKEATLAMTEERLRGLENRRCRLEEIESDLDRIEAQLDLSLDRAALHSSEPGGALQLDLAERMVDTADLFGVSHPMVRELDAVYQRQGTLEAS